MGNRANVYVHDGEHPGVYLYTHSCADTLPETVRAAMARKQRWNDDAYLARIIFSTMIKGREDDEAGFGISAREIGGQYVIDVDTDTRQVRVGERAPQSFAAFIGEGGAE